MQDDNPAPADDSPQSSSGLQKPDENSDGQSDSTQPKSVIARGAAMEKVVGGIVDKFMAQQQQAETRFFDFEEKCERKRETMKRER